jgi:acetyltransferase
LGFKRDSVFGDTFFFGAGGKYVSLLQDKNLCLYPLEEAKLKKLIESSKIFPLLNGYRGETKLDIEKIISLVRKLGFIFEHLPKIKEMEINPAIINQDNIYCVDTKIILT